MMNEEFAKYLKRGGRSKSAQDRATTLLSEFKELLLKNCEGKELDEAGPEEIHAFIETIEDRSGKSAKTHL